MNPIGAILEVEDNRRSNGLDLESTAGEKSVILLQSGGVISDDGGRRSRLVVRSNSSVKIIYANKPRPVASALIKNTDIIVEANATLTLQGIAALGDGVNIQVKGTLQLDTTGPRYPDPKAGSDDPVIEEFFNEIKNLGYPAQYLVQHPEIVVHDGATVKGNGVINANLSFVDYSSEANCGRLILGAEPDPGGIATPSPLYITVTGTLGTSNGILQVDVTSQFFGQLTTSSPVNLVNSRLEVHPSPDTSILNGNAYNIIRTSSSLGINGNFKTFNTVANNFANKTKYLNTNNNYWIYQISGHP